MLRHLERGSMTKPRVIFFDPNLNYLPMEVWHCRLEAAYGQENSGERPFVVEYYNDIEDAREAVTCANVGAIVTTFGNWEGINLAEWVAQRKDHGDMPALIAYSSEDEQSIFQEIPSVKTMVRLDREEEVLDAIGNALRLARNAPRYPQLMDPDKISAADWEADRYAQAFIDRMQAQGSPLNLEDGNTQRGLESIRQSRREIAASCSKEEMDILLEMYEAARERSFLDLVDGLGDIQWER